MGEEWFWRYYLYNRWQMMNSYLTVHVPYRIYCMCISEQPDKRDFPMSNQMLNKKWNSWMLALTVTIKTCSSYLTLGFLQKHSCKKHLLDRSVAHSVGFHRNPIISHSVPFSCVLYEPHCLLEENIQKIQQGSFSSEGFPQNVFF